MKPFEVMQKMTDDNMDIRLAPMNNISNVEIKGMNGFVTFGVPRSMAQDLIDGKEFYGGFVVCNKEQYEKLLNPPTP